VAPTKNLDSLIRFGYLNLVVRYFKRYRFFLLPPKIIEPRGAVSGEIPERRFDRADRVFLETVEKIVFVKN
jgi:hypothetical protein